MSPTLTIYSTFPDGSAATNPSVKDVLSRLATSA